MRFLLFIFFLLSFGQLAQAQLPYVRIDSLILSDIEGGKLRTKAKTVAAYLPFSVGDSVRLNELQEQLDLAQQTLLNSRLFKTVVVRVKEWEGKSIVLGIELDETLGLYPIPMVELADRNFNVWWKSFNFDLRRVNLGLWGLWRNPRGYNDLLKLIGQVGYSPKVELVYVMPPLGNKNAWGYSIEGLWSNNKELAYGIADNKRLFYRDLNSKSPQFDRLRFRLGLYFRQDVWSQQQLTLGFHNYGVSDSIFAQNADFLLGKARQRDFRLRYSWSKDRRDFRNYPFQGYYLQAETEKKGLGIFNELNQWTLGGHLGYYHKFGGGYWSVGGQLSGKLSLLRQKQAFFEQEALGFEEELVRGNQYYVIYGQDYLLWRSDLNVKLMELGERDAPFMALHLRYHLDYGYVWDRFYQQQGSLVNRSLWGTGPAIDLGLMQYRFVLQFEYSLNQSKETAFFFRLKMNL